MKNKFHKPNSDWISIILVIALSLMLCNCSRFPEKQPGMKSYIYKTVKNKKLKLYVFQPTKQLNTKDPPVVVFFHGGGFSGGKVSQFESQSHYLAYHGITAILVEYRLVNAHGNTPFECVEDAKSAIRWVRANSEELGISKDRIVAGGGSAGGHLAACTAFINGYDAKIEDSSISSVPNALVLFNPVVNFPESFKKANPKYHSDRLKEATEISPIHNVVKGAPPTIIFHGTADESVPYHHAELFCAEMARYGNICELVPFEGRNHGFFNYHVSKEDYTETMERTYEFLVSLGYLNDIDNDIK